MHIFILLGLSLSTYAQKPHPACVALMNACLKAGYTMQAPRSSDKSVISGCMAKIARGETVPKLAVKATDPAIKPCIDFMKGKIAQITSEEKPKPAPVKKVPANPPKKTGR